jgi:hypothetical protein
MPSDILERLEREEQGYIFDNRRRSIGELKFITVRDIQ